MKYYFDHIGINCKDSILAHHYANEMTSIFNMQSRQGHGYIFMDNTIELRETIFHGEKGHIALSVECIELAIEDLKKRDVNIVKSTLVKNDKNEIVSVYLDKELNGFAIHLVKKR